MWGKDDEVRALLSALGETLAVDAMSADEASLVIDTVLEPCLAAIEEMIAKEARILLPMSRETLTDDEWAEIWQESPRYGFCLVEPRESYRPPPVMAPERVAELPRDQAVVFPTGALTFDQLRGILGALVDITFVDVTTGPLLGGSGRVRAHMILGREVRHCHPPKSVTWSRRSSRASAPAGKTSPSSGSSSRDASSTSATSRSATARAATSGRSR
jgi:DUF438 domain-containing protein